MSEQREVYDAIVIGGGIGGATCARRLSRGGLRVALIERERIGGETAIWAPIPSSSLLGPANALWHVQAAAGVTSPGVGWPRHGAQRADDMPPLSDAPRTEQLEHEGITVIRGGARLSGAGRVAVRRSDAAEHVVEAAHVVIATGSTHRLPAVPGLVEAGFLTHRDVRIASSQPSSVILFGDQAEAVELAQLIRLYGSEVTLILPTDQLIPHEDPAVGELLADRLYHSGIRVLLGRWVTQVERDSAGMRTVTLDDGSHVRGQAVLAMGERVPRTEGLGLEQSDARVSEHGIAVDEYCRAGEGIWAIGDVTGFAHSTHMAQYQARLVADAILGRAHAAQYQSVPRIIFTEPQVAATGLTLAQAQAQHLAVASASLDLTERTLQMGTATPTVAGRFTLHADRERGVLIGAWAVAPDASEWIHLAVLAIRAGVPLAVLHDTVEQFPTFSEPYLRALDRVME